MLTLSKFASLILDDGSRQWDHGSGCLRSISEPPMSFATQLSITRHRDSRMQRTAGSVSYSLRGVPLVAFAAQRLESQCAYVGTGIGTQQPYVFESRAALPCGPGCLSYKRRYRTSGTQALSRTSTRTSRAGPSAPRIAIANRNAETLSQDQLRTRHPSAPAST